ncbi:hypothetical protein L6R50_18520 [Myxococcota bacterium]|nr:hypothetical protein [Myxococcota bacterium]
MRKWRWGGGGGGAGPTRPRAGLPPPLLLAALVALAPAMAVSYPAGAADPAGPGLAWRAGLPRSAGPAEYTIRARLARYGCTLLLDAAVLVSAPRGGEGRATLRFTSADAEFSVPPSGPSCGEDPARWEALRGAEGVLIPGFPPWLILAEPDPGAAPGRQAVLSMVAHALAPGLPAKLYGEGEPPLADPTAGALPAGPVLRTAALDARGRKWRVAATGEPGAWGRAVLATDFALAVEARRSDGTPLEAIASLLDDDGREVARVEARWRRRPPAPPPAAPPLRALLTGLDHLARLEDARGSADFLLATRPPEALAPGEAGRAAAVRGRVLAAGPPPPGDWPGTLRGALHASRAALLQADGRWEEAVIAAAEAVRDLGPSPRGASLARWARLATCWDDVPPSSPVRALREVLDWDGAGPVPSALSAFPEAARAQISASFARARWRADSCPGTPLPVPGAEGAFVVPLSRPGDGGRGEALVSGVGAEPRVLYLPVPGGHAWLAAGSDPLLARVIIATAISRGAPSPCALPPPWPPGAAASCLELLATGAVPPGAADLPSPFGTAFAVHDAWHVRGDPDGARARALEGWPSAADAPAPVRWAVAEALATLPDPPPDAVPWARSAMEAGGAAATGLPAVAALLCSSGEPGPALPALLEAARSPRIPAPVLDALGACAQAASADPEALLDIATRSLAAEPSPEGALLRATALVRMGRAWDAVDRLAEFEALHEPAPGEEEDRRVAERLAELRATVPPRTAED